MTDNYIILSAIDTRELAKFVNNHLDIGYRTVGGITFGAGVFWQAMVKIAVR